MAEMNVESVVFIRPKTVHIVTRYVLFGLLALSFVLLLLVGFLAVIPVAILMFLLYRLSFKTDAEYDYIHMDDTFEVAAVAKGKFRRKLCTVNLNHLVLVAPAEDPAAEAFAGVKATDYTGNCDPEKVYVMVYTANGTRKKLLLQLDEKMYKSLKR